MVAQMDADSMALVLKVLDTRPNSESRIIVSCRLQKTDKYDHKRHFAHRDKAKREKEQGVAPPQSRDPMEFLPPSKEAHRAGVQLKIWDFVLEFDDGSEVYLHPEYSNPKISCFAGAPQPDHELPRTGKGGSSGRGTYKFFKNKQYGTTLSFDKSKRPL